MIPTRASIRSHHILIDNLQINLSTYLLFLLLIPSVFCSLPWPAPPRASFLACSRETPCLELRKIRQRKWQCSLARLHVPACSSDGFVPRSVHGGLGSSAVIRWRRAVVCVHEEVNGKIITLLLYETRRKLTPNKCIPAVFSRRC